MSLAADIRMVCELLNPGGQSKLARLLPVNVRTVRRWLAGRSTPHPVVMDKITRIGRQAAKARRLTSQQQPEGDAP